MADAQGDIFRTDGLIVEEVDSKQNVAITKGEVVVFDTDGYRICAAADAAGTKAYMATSTVTATAATRKKVEIVRQGYCRVYKIGDGQYIGDTPTFDDNGGVKTGGNAIGNMVCAEETDNAAVYQGVFIG